MCKFTQGLMLQNFFYCFKKESLFWNPVLHNFCNFFNQNICHICLSKFKKCLNIIECFYLFEKPYFLQYQVIVEAICTTILDDERSVV